MQADVQPPKLRNERVRQTLGRANYFAVRIGKVVRLFAFGVNPTPGWINYFELSPLTIWPPQFLFFSIRPDTPVPEVITPFFVDTTFQGDDADSVIVWDAAGGHRVRIIGAEAFQAAAEGGDGPFPRQEYLMGWVSSG